MTWWCSASGTAWTWSWQAYPGVWLVVGALLGAYFWLVNQDADPTSSRERSLFVAGVLLLWIALDWPVGALGAGYLLSVHQLQYVLLVLIVPPLLLLGTPVWLLRRVARLRMVGPVIQRITRPVPAILLCNAIVVLTHLPTVVDSLMVSQLGSFILDLSWLMAGLVLWWPALSRIPECNALSYGGRFGYLLVATLIPSLPAAFFFFSDFPIYRLYELAPPLRGWTARDDQFVAGAVMKFGSFVVVLFALSVIFFQWYRSEEREAPIVSSTSATDANTLPVSD